MKKLIYFICLCVCLNGAAVFAEAPDFAEPDGIEVDLESAAVAEESASEADETEVPEEEEEAEAEAATESEPEADEPEADEPEADEPEADEPEADEPEADEPEEDEPEASGDVDDEPEEAAEEDKEASPERSDDSEAKIENAGEAEAQADEGDGQNDGAEDRQVAGDDDQTSGDTQAAGNDGQTSGDTQNTGNDAQNTDDQQTAGNDTQTSGDAQTSDDTQPTGDPQESADPQGSTDPQGDGATDPESRGMPADAEVWLIVNGRQVGGRLAEIVQTLSGDETVFVRTTNVLHLSDAPLYTLAGVRFRPDADIFSEQYVVKLYAENPEGKEDAAEADLSGVKEGDIGDLYIRVEQREGNPDEGEKEECTITVNPNSFEAGVWQTKRPTFKLSGIPQGKDWNYAVLIFDERIVPLSGDTYKLEAEGIYTLRFAIQDKLGDIKAISATVRGWFDWTPPKGIIALATDEDYAIDITGSDATSGVVAVSVDSGRTWVSVEDGETYRFSAKKKRTLLAGAIRIRDAAGNIYKSAKAYKLDKAPSLGGGGGTGTKKKELPHSSSDPEDAAPYALKLKLPEGTMRQLTIDGKARDLTLMVDRTSAGEGRKPAGFSAVLTNWLTHGEEDIPDPDTLVLEADVPMEDAFNCEWHFNGEVYRELAECGVRYLAFKVGGDLCVVPTEGFTGGSKYTELKMLGVSTRKFDYTLTMKMNTDPGHVTALTENDFSQDCDLALAVEVENMSYELSSSPKSLMYYYDVYLGPEEMIDYPFGEYGA